jgi:hypothetical protein
MRRMTGPGYDLPQLARRTISALRARPEEFDTATAISVDRVTRTAYVSTAGSKTLTPAQITTQETTDLLVARIAAGDKPTVEMSHGVVVGIVTAARVANRTAGQAVVGQRPKTAAVSKTYSNALGAYDVSTGAQPPIAPVAQPIDGESSLPAPLWVDDAEQFVSASAVVPGALQVAVSWQAIQETFLEAYRVRVVDVLGAVTYATVDPDTLTVTVTPIRNGLASVQVQAIGAGGRQGAWNVAKTAVVTTNAAAPVAAPTLSAFFQQVSITMAAPPLWVNTVEINVVGSVSGTKTVIISPKTLTTTVQGVQGETFTVKYRWLDVFGNASAYSPTAVISVAYGGIGYSDLAAMEQVALTSSNGARTAAQLAGLLDGVLTTGSFVPSSGEAFTFTYPMAVKIAGVIVYATSSGTTNLSFSYQDITGAWVTLGSNSSVDHTVAGSPNGNLLREYAGDLGLTDYVAEAPTLLNGTYLREYRFGDSGVAASRLPKSITAKSFRVTFSGSMPALTEIRVLTYEAANMFIARNLYLSDGARIANDTSTSGWEITTSQIQGVSAGVQMGRISTDGSLWWKSGGFGGTSAAPRITMDGATGNVDVAGDVTVGGNLRSGQTAYDTGTGFWIGKVSGAERFSIGNSGGSKLTWNGTTLAVTGAINAQSGSFTGAVSIGTGGSFSAGQSAYDTGTGWWLDYNSGTPRFSLGNAAGNKLTWNGTTLAITGSVTASAGSITGDLTIGTAGDIRSGQSAYNTGTGFWLGNVTGSPRFSIGNSAGSSLTWDGTTLAVTGAITAQSGSITGDLTIGTAGDVRSGQTAYDTGTGWWLGNVAGAARFSIGNSAGSKLTWNGTTLAVVGALTAQSGSFTGAVTVGTGGSFASGQSAYDTGTGWWMDYNAGTPRMSLGAAAGNKLTWNGSVLTVTGAINVVSGTVTGDTTTTGSGRLLTGPTSGARVEIKPSGIYGFAAASTAAFGLATTNGNVWSGWTLDAGDFALGRSTGNYLRWDDSAGALDIVGNGSGLINLNGGALQAGTITAASLNITVGGGNRVANGSFESGAMAPFINAGGGYTLSVYVPSQTVASNGAQHGNYVLRCQGTSVGTEYGRFFGDLIPIDISRPWTISAWMRRVAGVAASTKSHLRVIPYSFNGTTYTQLTLTYPNQDAPGLSRPGGSLNSFSVATTWTRYGGTFNGNFPATTTHVRFECYPAYQTSDATIEVWVDACQFEPGDVPSTYVEPVAGSIRADQISVSQLSAITASMGALTVDGVLGIATTGSFRFGAATAFGTGNGMYVAMPSGTSVQLRVGNVSGGVLTKGFSWDGTTSDFIIKSPSFNLNAAGDTSLTGIFSVGTGGSIRSGLATDIFTGDGLYIDYNAGNPRFRIGQVMGAGLTRGISWDGTAVAILSPTVELDTLGNLTIPTIYVGVPQTTLAWTIDSYGNSITDPNYHVMISPSVGFAAFYDDFDGGYNTGFYVGNRSSAYVTFGGMEARPGSMLNLYANADAIIGDQYGSINLTASDATFSMNSTVLINSALPSVDITTAQLRVFADYQFTGSLFAGSFKAGMTAYNSGIGWYMDYNVGTPRFSLGDASNGSTGSLLAWNGSILTGRFNSGLLSYNIVPLGVSAQAGSGLYTQSTDQNDSTAVLYFARNSSPLTLVYYFDSAAATYTDVTDTLSEPAGSAATIAKLAADYVYFAHSIGTYANIYVQISVAATTTGAMTLQYWNGTAWANVPGTWTDGTAVSGVTLAQSGFVSWTPPPLWAAGAASTIFPASPAPPADATARFWMRFKTATNATVDPTVLLINRGRFAGYYLRAFNSGNEKIRLNSTGTVFAAGGFYPGTGLPGSVVQGSYQFGYQGGAFPLFTNTSLQVMGVLSAEDVSLDDAAGVSRVLRWNTAGLNRWLMFADTTAESGADAGSNFTFQAANDLGSTATTIYSINRASKLTTWSQPLTVSGAFNSTGNVNGSTIVGTFENINTGVGAATSVRTAQQLTDLRLQVYGANFSTALFQSSAELYLAAGSHLDIRAFAASSDIRFIGGSTVYATMSAAGAWSFTGAVDVLGALTKSGTAVSLAGHAHAAADITSGTLAVAQGGTNIGAYAVGDLLYASTTGVLSRLADVATGNVLRSGGVGVAPAWGKVTLTTDVSGILPVANGGTNIATYAVGDLLYASATGVLSRLADVATGNVLLSGGVGVAPGWGKADLTTDVTGILPTANGGTGVNTIGAAGTYLMSTGSGLAYVPSASYVTADVTLTAAATVSTTLSFAIGASEKWVAHYCLYINNTAGVAGLKPIVTVPTGATGRMLAQGPTTGVGVYTSENRSTITTAGAQAFITAVFAGYIYVDVYIANSTTAGTVLLSLVTGASQAGQIQAGSSVQMLRVA